VRTRARTRRGCKPVSRRTFCFCFVFLLLSFCLFLRRLYDAERISFSYQSIDFCLASLKSIANGASADLFGFTGDALHLVSSQPAHIKHLTKLVSQIANNKLDDEVADVFRATKLIALPKKEFVPRPLGNCCVFPKLAADILMNRVKGER